MKLSAPFVAWPNNKITVHLPTRAELTLMGGQERHHHMQRLGWVGILWAQKLQHSQSDRPPANKTPGNNNEDMGILRLSTRMGKKTNNNNNTETTTKNDNDNT